MARDVKKVSLKLTKTDNDKYAFHYFLLRLGFIGKEHKTARKILFRNLMGNSVFRMQKAIKRFLLVRSKCSPSRRRQLILILV